MNDKPVGKDWFSLCKPWFPENDKANRVSTGNELGDSIDNQHVAEKCISSLMTPYHDWGVGVQLRLSRFNMIFFMEGCRPLLSE
jgi:hypothetical protein